MSATLIRHLRGRVIATLSCLVLGMLVAGCCPSTNPDVTPDCPGGTRAASAITINANLSSIRPMDQNIQLNIIANRTSTELCFQPRAQLSFTKVIEGTGTKTENLTNLADGAWDIEVQSLSGGNQQPVKLTKVLTPGTTHTLVISGNSAGDLQASFSN